MILIQSQDEEPVINLQNLLDKVYQEAALDLAIDYTQQPIPSVSDDGFAWIQGLS